MLEQDLSGGGQADPSPQPQKQRLTDILFERGTAFIFYLTPKLQVAGMYTGDVDLPK